MPDGVELVKISIFSRLREIRDFQDFQDWQGHGFIRFSTAMLAETLVYLVLSHAGWRWTGKISRFSRFTRFSKFSKLAGTWVYSFFSCYAGRDIGPLSSQSCRMALDWQDFKISRFSRSSRFSRFSRFRIFKIGRATGSFVFQLLCRQRHCTT